ncbi:MAG: hypothetical protein RR705_09550 [Lachnospiraceae bacterium]
MVKKFDTTTIGGRIRNCRLKAEMTQEEFSGDMMNEIEKEMLVLLKIMKTNKIRQIALEQLRVLTAIEK